MLHLMRKLWLMYLLLILFVLLSSGCGKANNNTAADHTDNAAPPTPTMKEETAVVATPSNDEERTDPVNPTLIEEDEEETDSLTIPHTEDEEEIAAVTIPPIEMNISSLSANPIATLKSESPVVNIIFSSDEQYLVVLELGSFTSGYIRDSSVTVYTLPQGQETVHFNSSFEDIALSSDNRYIAVVPLTPGLALSQVGDIAKNYTALVYEMPGEKEVLQVSHKGDIKAVAFSPDSRYLATVSGDFYNNAYAQTTADNDYTARVWEIASGQEVLKLGHKDDVWDVAFSPDGNYLATVSGNFAQLWDLNTGLAIARLSDADTVTFSPDGRYMGSKGIETVRVLDIQERKEIVTLAKDSVIRTMTFSPDSRYIALASVVADITQGTEGNVHVYDIHNASEMTNLSHSDGFLDVDFSPDGRYLATVDADGTIHILDLSNNVEVVQVSGSQYHKVVFSPNGQYLAAASWQGPGPTGSLDGSGKDFGEGTVDIWLLQP